MNGKRRMQISEYGLRPIGANAYSPTRRARIYEPEAAPVGLRIEKETFTLQLRVMKYDGLF